MQAAMIRFAYLTLNIIFHSTVGLDLNTFNKYHILKKTDVSIRNTTDRCQVDADLFWNGINDGERWALQMLDASGSIPSGLYSGSVMDLGFFDQCLGISHRTGNNVITGKYCRNALLIPLSSLNFTASMRDKVITRHHPIVQPPTITNYEDNDEDVYEPSVILLALCIPDSCEPSDIFGILGVDDSCTRSNDGSNLEPADICCLVFLGIIVLLLAFSTIYDMLIRHSKKTSRHPILLAFSVYTNGEKLFKTSNLPGQITCFNGIKAISALWIVAGHSFGMIPRAVNINTLDVPLWMDKWYSFYIMMAPLAVDTFLFVTGVLIAYIFLRTMSKPNAKFNVFQYYLHRYLRIMPALAAMYFVTVTVVRYIGSGPAWNSYMGNMRDNCLNNWWSFFFYFHNYMREGICLGHTWYLAVDMQLFILSPILLIPLLKYPKHAMCYEIPIVIAISIAIPVAVFYVYDIQAFTAGYNDYYYYATHTRFAPWVIGIAFGAFFARNLPGQTKFNLSWSLNLSIWVAALAVAAAIFLSERDTRGNGHAEKLRHILHRPVWAVCLGWFSFACTYGYGTFVNWFLSLGVFQVLSKLSYSIYIVHITIIFIHLGRQRTTNYFDDYFAMYNVFGDTILTIGVAVFWTLAFESPMITIEKVLFAKGTPNNTKGTQNKTVPEIKVS